MSTFNNLNYSVGMWSIKSEADQDISRQLTQKVEEVRQIVSSFFETASPLLHLEIDQAMSFGNR